MNAAKGTYGHSGNSSMYGTCIYAAYIMGVLASTPIIQWKFVCCLITNGQNSLPLSSLCLPVCLLYISPSLLHVATETQLLYTA